MLSAPLYFSFCVHSCSIVFESLLFCQLCLAFLFPMSSAIPLTPIFSSLFLFCFFCFFFFSVFFLRVSPPELTFVEFSSGPHFRVLVLHALDFCSFLVFLFLPLSALVLLLFLCSIDCCVFVFPPRFAAPFVSVTMLFFLALFSLLCVFHLVYNNFMPVPPFCLCFLLRVLCQVVFIFLSNGSLKGCLIP